MHDKFVESVALTYSKKYNTEGAIAAQEYVLRVLGNDKSKRKLVREKIKQLSQRKQ